METPELDAKTIWNNRDIPVLLRRGGSNAIRLRMPYHPGNRTWLRNGERKRMPDWVSNGRYWELPASRFNELVEMFLHRFGQVYILQPYREREICSPSCMNAVGFECQCSCFGANHGMGNDGRWFEVSEACAVRFGPQMLGCRLLRMESTNHRSQRAADSARG